MSQLLLLSIGKQNDTTWLSSEEIKTEAKTRRRRKAFLLYEY